ncbi:MAG: hypothetical protein COA44_04630 [Arcobacter sp.]|nr:MAG: hypothetical protein COA44_04630 [Arcobacter sp.]
MKKNNLVNPLILIGLAFGFVVLMMTSDHSKRIDARAAAAQKKTQLDDKVILVDLVDQNSSLWHASEGLKNTSKDVLVLAQQLQYKIEIGEYTGLTIKQLKLCMGTLIAKIEAVEVSKAEMKAGNTPIFPSIYFNEGEKHENE